ncbi:terminase large subunit domain-containing protein [Mucisphaera sp.]|uniref:phage terminase large subunit family protein n=1 Tax=Mucisphaera sp. TaxID=2913024 RepID=UPI003D129DBF
MPDASRTLARRPGARLRLIQTACPHTPHQLHRFVHLGLGVNITRQPLLDDSNAPFDYLAASFFADHHPANQLPPNLHNLPADLVVWASRGSGKTMLGAIATLLDLLFKQGIQLRILGGSLDQSLRMHEHLLRLLHAPLLHDTQPGSDNAILATAPTQRSLTLSNGSRVELLAQSHRSIRGTRVHRLRCDEVDEFQTDIWQAAQLTTRSGTCGDWQVRGSVHALSTAHRPSGLMATLTGQHTGPDQPQADTTTRRILRWTTLDVAAQCPPDKPCDPCPLQPECQGQAKHANGFIPIDDLIQLRARTSENTWQSEMLCERPTIEDAVYPSFDPARHVLVMHLEPEQAADTNPPCLLAGMDFGLRSPTAFIWARQYQSVTGLPHLHIIDEYRRTDLTLDQHIDRILARGHANPKWLAVDPAGSARNAQTGRSDIQRLRDRGFRIRSRRHPLRDGIERVRTYLDRNRLTIDPRCEHLIHALQTYHFDHRAPHTDTPVKDGPDHLADALRYLIVNLDLNSHATKIRFY